MSSYNLYDNDTLIDCLSMRVMFTMQINAVFADVFSMRAPHWLVVDQWSINRGRQLYFNDRIHYEGILTDAGIQQFLNAFCDSQYGTQLDIPENIPTDNEMQGGRLIRVTSKHPNEYYYVDAASELHQLSGDSKSPCIRQYLREDKVVAISESVLKYLPVKSPILPTDGCTFK